MGIKIEVYQSFRLFHDDTPKSNRNKVSMVGWSSDDEFVVAAVTDFAIQVWNSHSGTLVHTLKGHKDEVFVVECNPVLNSVLLTAGHDGLIILWDIISGSHVKTFTNDVNVHQCFML